MHRTCGLVDECEEPGLVLPDVNDRTNLASIMVAKVSSATLPVTATGILGKPTARALLHQADIHKRREPAGFTSDSVCTYVVTIQAITKG